MTPFLLRSSTAALLFCVAGTPALAQSAQPIPYAQQHVAARPLPIDRGSAALEQSLRKLGTRASLAMVVAHPDDEDGGMLAYESRGQGVDTTLLTLNRGEGGQNDITSDYWDELGILRTEELLAAGNYYGVHQYWTRVADFGFSKTIDEALKTWGEQRVLYDVVRVIRMTRPLVVSSVFVGNVSDGHGHHQVAGYMAQEAYKLAGDPNVFPDQIKAGLLPWSPLKVYARVPFARVTDKGIYDYATGHYAPVRFRNYVDGTWIEGLPKASVEIPEGTYNPLFGENYLQVAREGLDQQKSQNGGVAVPLPRPNSSPYHLYAARFATQPTESSFFDGIDVTLEGIASYAPAAQQAAWRTKLHELSTTVDAATKQFDATHPESIAPLLAKGLAQTNALLDALAKSSLPAEARYNMAHELGVKQAQFNDALAQSLGLSLLANTTEGNGPVRPGPFGDLSTQLATSQTVVPGQSLDVEAHLANQSSEPVTLSNVAIVSQAGKDWTITPRGATSGEMSAGSARDLGFTVKVPADAELTRPYFSRPELEQPYYDIRDPRYLNLPTAPYPLLAVATVQYRDVTLRLNGVVQTVQQQNGIGPVMQPLRVAPAISLSVTPQAGIVPLTSGAFTLQVKLHSSVKGAARGTLRLDLPSGWSSTPATADFATTRDGEERNLSFVVQPGHVEPKPYNITAVAELNGQQYKEGFETIGYPGLRPYVSYKPASYRATGVDVKTAPGLKVAYVMGTGDDVGSSLEDLGVHPAFLSAQDIATGDLSQYDAIVLGIRAYAARPELKTFNSRLLDYAKNGGTVIVQYQTQEYDHNFGPYPLSLSGDPEKVVEEDCKVQLLAPNDPLLSWPNKITTKDFEGWVEERGHGFLHDWDSHYIAPTEMHDVDQDPQKGGLVYTRYGKGYYIYMAFAFFRQMPEGVPGSYRIMANLISAGKNQSLAASGQ